MTPCDRCSDPRRRKTVYHVGDCPKAPLIEWVTIPAMRNPYIVQYDQWVREVISRKSS